LLTGIVTLRFAPLPQLFNASVRPKNMSQQKIQGLRAQCMALQKAMDASRTSRTDDVWLHSSFKTFM